MEQTFSYSSQLYQIAVSAIAIFFRDFHDITIRHGRPRGVYASGKFPTIVEISEVAHNGGTLKPFAAYSIKIKLSEYLALTVPTRYVRDPRERRWLFVCRFFGEDEQDQRINCT